MLHDLIKRQRRKIFNLAGTLGCLVTFRPLCSVNSGCKPRLVQPCPNCGLYFIIIFQKVASKWLWFCLCLPHISSILSSPLKRCIWIDFRTRVCWWIMYCPTPSTKLKKTLTPLNWGCKLQGKLSVLGHDLIQILVKRARDMWVVCGKNLSHKIFV